MADGRSEDLIDLDQFDEPGQVQRSALHIRWWVPMFAVVLCAGQAILNLSFESRAGSATYLIATQISVIAFGFLFVLCLAVNPFLHLGRTLDSRAGPRCWLRRYGPAVVLVLITAAIVWRSLPGSHAGRAWPALLPLGAGLLLLVLVMAPKPLNRAELMALFAAMFVSAGISSFGLVDQLIPLIAAPFNSRWNTPQSGWGKDIIPHLNRHLFITDTSAIEQFRDGFGTNAGLWARIPWSVWVKPLALWMIFVTAMYVMFYALSLLVYDTWARREKLVFPLARLPEDVIGASEEDAAGGAVATTHNGLFWLAFAVVFLFLFYNGACQAGWLRGFKALRMGLDQNALQGMLSRSIFNGIAHDAQYNLRFVVIFTAMGLAFLLPQEISRSLWIYHLTGLSLLMAAIWFGVGGSVRSFRSDWLVENHFVSSLGAGGLMAFSANHLMKVSLDRWANAKRTATKSGWVAILHLIGWGGGLFILAGAVSLGWLCWSGVSFLWAASFLAIVVLITIGLMRVVAEGGVYWFQVHVSPFHLSRVFGGLKTIPAAVLAPLMTIYSVLLLDIKTYMAPAVLNSFKMQEETRASRRRFHWTVALAIAVTVIASTIAILHIAYSVGADRASGWFFTGAPVYILNQTQRMVGGTLGTIGNLNWLFYLFGAGWVVLSILVRRRFFWWLHPIGFVMLANPLMASLWFSFFIGWLCKRLAVKYGGRHMFARTRPFFVGLIMGELAACFLWALLAQWLGLDRVAIDINRNLP